MVHSETHICQSLRITKLILDTSALLLSLNVRDWRRERDQPRESPASSGGFKACNCQLHRLWQDVEFVDMKFPQNNFVVCVYECVCKPLHSQREKNSRWGDELNVLFLVCMTWYKQHMHFGAAGWQSGWVHSSGTPLLQPLVINTQ